MNTQRVNDPPSPFSQPDPSIDASISSTPMQVPPPYDAEYRPLRSMKSGLLLGALAGCTSLLFNIVGSVLWPAFSGQPQHPLRMIQVYLTFPFGESALHFNDGLLLALGCLLYLATGMLYGMLFQWAISYLIPRAGLTGRLIFCSLLAVFIWAINFYAILSWLQQLVVGRRWVLELLPWWVASLTHLVFGWTMACIYPLGNPSNSATTDSSEIRNTI